MSTTPKLNEAASGGSSPVPCSVSLVWHAGPAKGGGGTAQDESPDGRSWWRDGDLLLVLVETNGGPFVRLVTVNADGEMLDFQDPDTGDFSFGYEASDISWWAKIEESLPQNACEQPTSSADGKPELENKLER